MTQSSNRILDDLARLVADVAGAAQGVQREADAIMRSQAERILRSLDVVRREEFEVVKAMAAEAREENTRLAEANRALEARVAALEAERGRGQAAPPPDWIA